MSEGEETSNIEGLGSGLASSKKEGVAFDPEQIEPGPGVPTGDQRPSADSADVGDVTESGSATNYRIPEKEEE